MRGAKLRPNARHNLQSIPYSRNVKLFLPDFLLLQPEGLDLESFKAEVLLVSTTLTLRVL